MISKSKKFTQVIQSSLRILSETMQYDIGLHRKPVFSLEKPVGSDLDFVGILRPNSAGKDPIGSRRVRLSDIVETARILCLERAI